MNRVTNRLLLIIMSLLLIQGCGSTSNTQNRSAANNYVAEAGSDAELNGSGIWATKSKPNLPKVLLLGDSVSIGYTIGVRDTLQDQANIFRPIKNGGKRPENCQGTLYSLKHIDRWLGQKKWDVIHFNWGLHDLKHWKVKEAKNSNNFNDPRQSEPEVYRANLNVLVDRLESTGAKLIFATTTPYPAGVSPARLPADAALYNSIAIEVMKERNIQVNDLYSYTLGNLDTWQKPKNVHFTQTGNLMLTKEVSKVILNAL